MQIVITNMLIQYTYNLSKFVFTTEQTLQCVCMCCFFTLFQTKSTHVMLLFIQVAANCICVHVFLTCECALMSTEFDIFYIK